MDCRQDTEGTRLLGGSPVVAGRKRIGYNNKNNKTIENNNNNNNYYYYYDY